MPVTHRPVQEKDISIICSFPQNEEELYFLFPKANFPLMPSQLQNAIAKRSDSTVVEHKGKVVAFANFYRFEPMGSFAIGNVIVAPTSRGQGIGRHLIKQMVSIAFSKHQAREVTVSCFNRNVGGLLLYPKLGFYPYAIEERLDQKGERVALIHMRLSRIAP